MTALEAIQLIDKHAENLCIPRPGHAALMQILDAVKRQAEADEAKDKAGPA